MRADAAEQPTLSSAEAGRVVSRQALAFLQSKALSVASELGIADLLVDGPRSADELAAATNTRGPALYRILRKLANIGIFTELPGRRFELNEAADTLRTDRAISLRDLVLYLTRWTYSSANEIMHSVQTGEAAFDKQWGAPIWEYFAEHLEAGELFIRAGQGGMLGRAVNLRDYDWNGDETVVDIGGGGGGLLIDLLRHREGLTGIIADLPHVVAAAEANFAEAGLSDRASGQAFDFFNESPPEGDVYTASVVLHDWDDERTIDILEHIRSGMKPGAKLLLVELVAGVGDEHDLDWLLDLAMLVECAGMERTEPEWRAVLAAGGFEVTQIIPGLRWSIIETRPRSAPEGALPKASPVRPSPHGRRCGSP